MNWIEAISAHNTANTAFVLVTVLETEGSSPRGTDAKMVVTANCINDTVGGGSLEFQVTQSARQLITAGKRCSKTQQFNLSKDLKQCCGGKVTVLLECFPESNQIINLFGAGHVGQAIIKILGDTKFRVRWIDSRPEYLEQKLTANIQPVQMHNPDQAVEECAPNGYYLVMTHDHDLDQELCEAILSRGDSQFCGLIGSKSKAASFRSRFKRKGFKPEEVSLLTSPIGLPDLPGKSPMEVAVSVVAQIFQLQHKGTSNNCVSD